MMAIRDKDIDGGSCRHIVEIRLTNPNIRCVDAYQTTPINNNNKTLILTCFLCLVIFSIHCSTRDMSYRLVSMFSNTFYL